MIGRAMRLVVWLACVLWVGVAAVAPAAGQSGLGQPASQATGAEANDAGQWGPARAGLQLRLAGSGPAAGGDLEFLITLRNMGTAAVKLPPAGQVVGWFTVGQQVSDGEKVWYSQRYYLAVGQKDWPAELAPGKAVTFEKLALAEGTAYASADARKLLNAYLAGQAASDVPAAGKLGELLRPGEAVARFTLMLPQDAPPPLAVSSARLTVTVRARPLAAMDAEGRKKFLADLLSQFDKDEYAGQQAHHTAVAMGKDLVPYLVEAVKDRKRPKFSRMWLATAVADISDDRSAEALIELLEDPLAGVRYVVAYHGPKQRSDKLDQAIVDKVDKSRDAQLTAYAVLGFTVFRKEAPERLLKLSLDSPDPKVRAAVAAALKDRASDYNLQRLCGLLKDDDERVRASAARMLAELNRRTPEVLRAMVEALQAPGEYARQRIAQALVQMTGQNWPYDPKADAASREETLQKWRDWIQRAPKRQY